MAQDNKGEAKKTLVKNTEDMHPEEETSRSSQEPGTTSRTKTGARDLPGAFGEKADGDLNEKQDQERAS